MDKGQWTGELSSDWLCCAEGQLRTFFRSWGFSDLSLNVTCRAVGCPGPLMLSEHRKLLRGRGTISMAATLTLLLLLQDNRLKPNPSYVSVCPPKDHVRGYLGI